MLWFDDGTNQSGHVDLLANGRAKDSFYPKRKDTWRVLDEMTFEIRLGKASPYIFTFNVNSLEATLKYPVYEEPTTKVKVEDDSCAINFEVMMGDNLWYHLQDNAIQWTFNEKKAIGTTNLSCEGTCKSNWLAEEG